MVLGIMSNVKAAWAPIFLIHSIMLPKQKCPSDEFALGFQMAAREKLGYGWNGHNYLLEFRKL
jgi:hypothetical protein